jgi:signal transduction histidine kinase
VLGWTQILRSQKGAKSPGHALEVIERNASSQLRLVEDLLDMARIVSGKLRLDVKPIDIQAVVQAAVDVVEPGAAAKRVEIRPHFDDKRIPVNADADRLQQAIWNVMSNALKFTSAGGTIDVAVAAQAGSSRSPSPTPVRASARNSCRSSLTASARQTLPRAGATGGSASASP